MLDVWRFAFFGDSVSGAIILGLSGTLTGAASAACGATPEPIAAVIVDDDAAATLTFALAVAAAVAGTGAGAELRVPAHRARQIEPADDRHFMLDDDLAMLRLYRDLGVRQIHLAYNRDNSIAGFGAQFP